MLWLLFIRGRDVNPELSELTKVVADISDAAINPALWRQALASICAYVGGQSGVLYWHDAAEQSAQAVYRFNDDPEYTQLYFEKYLPMNPLLPAATFVDAGIVTSSQDIMPRSEFVETRFYKEWIRPQGMEDALSVNLEKGATRTSLINIRTEVVPNDDMRARMTLLVPHLQRAVAIGRLLDQHQATEQALTMSLDHVETAVFLVGADGAIAFANAPATKMLDKAVVVRKRGRILRAAKAETDRMLRDIFISAARGDASLGARGVAVPLGISTSERWFAHVLPLTSDRRQQTDQTTHAVAAVLVHATAPKAPPPLEAIARLYKLTAAEVRVLDAVLKINGVRAMADVLGISEGTVRTHLHSLFGKTGTRRQSDLVKLVAGI